MASPNRREDTALIERLLAHSPDFDFFQAVRLMELAARQGHWEGQWTGDATVGRASAPEAEAVRFRALPSRRFASALVHAIRPPAEGLNGPRGPEMDVTFLGLAGAAGVLPDHYTELVISRVRQRDYVLRDFLDLFNHRLLSLFYRAWEKYHYSAAYAVKKLRREPDPVVQALRSTVGLGTVGLQGRLATNDDAFVFYAGHYARRQASPDALATMLSDHFAVPVHVEQFVGRWLTLEATERTKLGRRTAQFNGLGRDAVLGPRIWDVQSKFRLRVGPLTYDNFQRFLPSSSTNDLRRLWSMVRLLVGAEFSFEVNLVLNAAEIPRCELTADRRRGLRLGWNTWLARRPRGDGDEPRFRLEAG